jgi:hydrogenase maturation protein HypF
MAASWLLASHGDQIVPPPTIGAAVDRRSWDQVSQLAGAGLASPTTTSMGRLFDAVAALCGLRMAVNYEGQAATELEAACNAERSDAYPLPVADGNGKLILDARQTVLAVLADVKAGAPVARVAARFHGAVAAATVTACIAVAAQHDLDVVVLSGGTFQNRVLLEQATHGLQRAGLRVLIPELLPPNDGGISYGQAAIAAAVLR